MSKDAHNEERRSNANFVRRHAVDKFRDPIVVLQDCWREDNARFFAGALVEPHLGLGKTAACRLAHCSPTTEDGRLVQITLSARLVLNPVNREWVMNPWPSAGLQRLCRDLLLRCATRQYVLEQLGVDERGYEDYGPLFTQKANSISLELGLPPVVVRNRGAAVSKERLLVARFWPVNVRLLANSDYYGDDVTQHLLDLAAGTAHAARRVPSPPSLGYMEYFLCLLGMGKPERLRELLARHTDRLQRLRERRLPVLRRAESGNEDVDGSPLGTVSFDPAWLRWNNCTVSKMVEAIHQFRGYADLPILADSLEDAGCDDQRILRHLRYEIENTYRCWVMRGLREADLEIVP